MSNNRVFQCGLYFTMVMMILAGCQSPSAESLEAALLPVEIADAMQEVLANCPIQNQTIAMHPDHLPEWTNLEFSACYQMSLDLSAGNGVFDGDLRITFPNRTGQLLDEIVFRLYPNAKVLFGGRLEVKQVLVEGEIVQPEVFLEDKTGLRIPLKNSLSAGEILEMELLFEGQAPENFGGFERAYGALNFDSENQLLTLANAYPILAVWGEDEWVASEVLGIGDAVVSETALYEVNVKVPAGWNVVATGSTISPTSTDKGQFHFVTGPVREFLVIASPSLDLLEATSEGVKVRHWGLANGEPYWEEVLQITLDSVSTFSDSFGPYPYAELDVVAIPMQNASGIEYPGIFLLRDTLYKPNPDEPYLLSIVASHEVAHQWWYGLVGSDVLIHPWQDEALTTFSSLLYMEIFQPQFYSGNLSYFRQISNQFESVSIEQPVEAFITKPDEYGSIVYLRGAMLFQELKEHLGEDVFLQALQTYYRNNVYQLNEPIELLNAFESQCECDLSEVYVRWGVE